MSTLKKVVLRSNDGESFEVEEAVAMKSKTIKNIIEDGCVGDNSIAIHNVNGSTLAKVIEYCKRHVEFEELETSESNDSDEESYIDSFDYEFIDVDQDTLFDLILAANYLEIEDLLHLGCEAVADMIKGKTTEEIRRTLNIKNDFTPEEEEQILEENAWAFD